VVKLAVSNFPVGLIAGASYEADTVVLQAGDRVVMVSDGFTEAADASGDFYGDERFEVAIRCTAIEDTLRHMTEFCAGHPFTDDVTIVQCEFVGAGGPG
jgi:sigma-B regulation protein RsbU (phosphoserine phosphatase)